MSDNQATQTPQFSTADYGTSSAGNTCQVCKNPVGKTYYRANAAVVCGRCTDNLKRQLPQDDHAAFVRAILFGIGGFAAGMAIYAGFVIATGISIGYLSLAVGWIIGKAMMTGSKGVGGRRYQIAAVLLTYASVSIAYIPILIHFMKGPTSDLAANAGKLALWGLASPFLRLQAGPSAILGLIILAVGMQFAWKMTASKGTVITGPFESARAASA